MKNNNAIEVVLFSKYSLTDLRQKELVKWLGTTYSQQSSRQHDTTKKLFPVKLKGSPAIYLS